MVRMGFTDPPQSGGGLWFPPRLFSFRTETTSGHSSFFVVAVLMLSFQVFKTEKKYGDLEEGEQRVVSPDSR